MGKRTTAIFVVASAFAFAAGATHAAAQGKASIWGGVYSQAQAQRGADVHSSVCAKCHGNRLNGAGWPDQPPSPAIAREGFLKRWEGKPLSELADYIREKMPADDPGGLTDEEISDAIAQMLALSAVPPGSKDLSIGEKSVAETVITAGP
jgi:mono/diheme cytochrome c family protein